MATITATIQTTGPYITNSDIKDKAIGVEKLAQRPYQPKAIPLASLRQTGSLATPLAATASNPNAGLYGGTFGTDIPRVSTEDVKAAGAITRKARFEAFLPSNYEEGETVVIRFHAGMVTTVADVSATLDLEVRKVSGNTLSVDLCATAAQDINDTTFANFDFTITPTSLVAGDKLDCEITFAVNDGATATAVVAGITEIFRLVDTQG